MAVTAVDVGPLGGALTLDGSALAIGKITVKHGTHMLFNQGA